jgi:exodeoxyribonuclease VII large subunit
MAERRAHAAARVRELARALHAVSPVRTLDRGYAIVYRNGAIVRDAEEVAAGDSITARLARGHLGATVTSADPDG